MCWEGFKLGQDCILTCFFILSEPRNFLKSLGLSMGERSVNIVKYIVSQKLSSFNYRVIH